MLSPRDPLLLSRRRTPLTRAVRRGLLAAEVTGPIVVGCSGGPDSTALLIALAALAEPMSLRLHVVAVDHQLRRAAAKEAEAVCEVAASIGATIEIVAVQVPAGASRMAAARSARYEALGEAAQRRGARFVAVGHTRDDQAETVLMRLLGGAGLTGLSGMSMIAPFPTETTPHLSLLRPLLSVSRREVEAFLSPLSSAISPLPFADPTNADPRYLRTRLRDEALPLLRTLAPHLDEHLLQLSGQLRADAEHLDAEALRALAMLPLAVEESSVRLSVKAIASLPRAIAARVLRLVSERHLQVSLSQRHVEALLSLCRDTDGRADLDLPGCLAQRRKDALLLSRREATGAAIY